MVNHENERNNNHRNKTARTDILRLSVKIDATLFSTQSEFQTQVDGVFVYSPTQTIHSVEFIVE